MRALDLGGGRVYPGRMFTVAVPTNLREETDWVSASRTRNHCIDDPLLDWLAMFGAARGFVPDDERPGFDERTDFSRFIMRQGQRFEEAVFLHLASLAPIQ